MGINRGGGWGIMTQVLLDQPQIDPLFKEMGGVGMPQGMHRGILVNPGLFERIFEGDLHRGPGDGIRWFSEPAAAGGRKEPDRVAMGFPELAQKIERPFRERYIAILGPLAVHMQKFSGTVDVADFKGGAFLEAQATGINGGQTNAVARQLNVAEYTPDLLDA